MSARAALAVLLLISTGAAGQVARISPAPAPGTTSVIAPIGERYAGGWLRRFLLGSNYRELWSAPVTIPVLDLEGWHGGLTPVSRGGGQQTTSLRLHAADGTDHYFRSIDKDPTPNLPPELVGTVAAGIVQDQISSALPTAPLVVAPLLEAAGVLHGTPELYILPDDERLGEFRPALAGLIGMLEPRIGPGWGGATEVISGDELFERVARSPDDRVDVPALLTARLVDMLVGDWDRHRDQWSWARFGDAVPRRWVPVPRDRDFAMVSYDGLLLAAARMSLPQLIAFKPTYPDILGLTWNGRELDRYFLLELAPAAWDSIAAAVQGAVTDRVIAGAVERLPPEHRALIGDRLEVTLRQRRDGLPAVARRFHRMLAEQVDLFATDASEVAEVTSAGDHAARVRLGRPGEAPYFDQVFDRRDTRELRLFLRGGDDTARVEGHRPDGIRVRVIGGDGADVVEAAPGGARAYDTDPGTVVSAGVHLDRRRYTPPPKRIPTEIPPRDWGHRWQSGGLVSGGPDIGVLLGVSRTYTAYRFRTLPFASRHRFRAGVATGPWTYRADYKGEFRPENSRSLAVLRLRASGIDVLRFHGLGNETSITDSRTFYRVTQQQYGVELSLVEPLGRHGEFSIGPRGRYVSTDDRPGRFLATLNAYGADGFGEVGAHGTLTLDSRPAPNAATTGIRLTAGGSVYPAWWDVTEAYGELHGEAATVLNLPAPLDPSLRVRVGGQRIWGKYPYFDAAFIGGAGTVRLGRENRFAGDASAWLNSELRLALGRLFLGAPSDFGVLGLGDVGRVFLAGEHSDVWHGAAGGGVWVSILDRANSMSLVVARGEERTAFYFQAGFGF